MKKTRFSEEQMVNILREADATTVAEVGVASDLAAAAKEEHALAAEHHKMAAAAGK